MADIKSVDEGEVSNVSNEQRLGADQFGIDMTKASTFAATTTANGQANEQDPCQTRFNIRDAANIGALTGVILTDFATLGLLRGELTGLMRWQARNMDQFVHNCVSKNMDYYNRNK